jgi:hypothetical protein
LHFAGTHPVLEKMRQEVPAGVLEMISLKMGQINDNGGGGDEPYYTTKRMLVA